MSTVEIRPRFQREVDLSAPEVLRRLDKALQGDEGVSGRISDHHVVLGIPEEEQHFWSPQLSLEVETLDENSALMRGLFGPKPTVWLMFIFFYALLGFICLIVAIIGFSQLNLGLSGAILWLLPVFLGIIVMMYLSARAGQRMGHDQMVHLHHFVENALQPAAARATSPTPVKPA